MNRITFLNIIKATVFSIIFLLSLGAIGGVILTGYIIIIYS